MPLIAAILFYFAQAVSPWSVQTSGIDTNLRGISVKCEKKQACVIWASGSNGVILRSIDDGKSWNRLTVADATDLDFRDVEAFDANTAYVMSSGEGDKSRIYKTTDGGTSWQLQYSDKRAGFFLDSVACNSRTHCVAVSDPVEGKFPVLSTNDGEHWKELSRDHMPDALPQEGAFAASGTVIALCEDRIFFATGGPAARVFSSKDQGRSWKVVNSPIISGNPSSGIFSITCMRNDTLVTVGGDYKNPDHATQIAAFSHDNGETWQVAASQPAGYRSAVTAFSGQDLLVVGPTGTDISHDKGVHWSPLDSLNLNAVKFDGTQGWAIGPKGTIVRFEPSLLR